MLQNTRVDRSNLSLQGRTEALNACAGQGIVSLIEPHVCRSETAGVFRVLPRNPQWSVPLRHSALSDEALTPPDGAAYAVYHSCSDGGNAVHTLIFVDSQAEILSGVCASKSVHGIAEIAIPEDEQWSACNTALNALYESQVRVLCIESPSGGSSHHCAFRRGSDGLERAMFSIYGGTPRIDRLASDESMVEAVVDLRQKNPFSASYVGASAVSTLLPPQETSLRAFLAGS